MTRGIPAAINNLQSSAAVWRFSTCCENLCANIGLTRQRCRALLSCRTPHRDFCGRGARDSSARAPRTTRAIPRQTWHQVRHEFRRYSLGFRIPFPAQMGQRLHGNIRSVPRLRRWLGRAGIDSGLLRFLSEASMDWEPDRERLGTNCPALARSMSRLSSPRGCLTTLWAIIAPSSSSNACLCSRGHRAINFCADAKRLPVKQSGYRTSAKSPTTTTESGLEGGVVVVVLLSMD